MTRILRVFARKTNLTPVDDLAFYDVPGLFIPEHDEVHVVVTFTWDIERGKWLRDCWQDATDKPVLIGGAASDDPCTGDFVPGLYLKHGVTITSRGCVNACPWCLVHKREGKLREIENFAAGNIVQDNNFLACSKAHKAKVYEMLKGQRQIDFRGGLESEYFTDWDIEQMRGLRIFKLWLACDSRARVTPFLKTCERLVKAGFSRDKIHCYVLCGDDMEENEDRMKIVFNAGALPFAQLEQPREWKEYTREWKKFARLWSRPALYKAYLMEGAA